MRKTALALAAIAATGVVVWQAVAAGPTLVSQRNRSFQPGAVELARGGVLRIVNDDGELLHHAFIKSATFNVDSGEQEPGSTTDVAFPVAGTFMMMCGIHPKMRLAVTVK